MLRALQIAHPRHGRRIGLPSDNRIGILGGFNTVYEAAVSGFERGTGLEALLRALPVEELLSYDDLYERRSDWKILPPFDHPSEPARCLVSGTGLTHLASAETRQKMHGAAERETDSMRMYRWGVDGGRPEAGSIGTAPEWFYKGNGLIVRAHGEDLEVHSFAEDGGEEPEIAGIYTIDSAGQPRRIGMAAGNEFSDHKTERRNYLYLASSKLRQCSLGPELIIDPSFDLVQGRVTIERNGAALWSREIGSGEKRMSHSLANLEHHHFKFPQHRRPGDVHIHFYGADAFSFGAGLELHDDDVAVISFDGFGRALRNSIRVARESERLVTAHPA